MVKKVVFWCLVGFALIQFIPVDRNNPPVDYRVNFVDSKKTPVKIKTLLKGACYDCHSNETIYPKYAYIAPVSWAIKSHVNDGRKHLNFSLWETYNSDLKISMLKHTTQALQKRTMPMPGYIVYHQEANLTEAERQLLINYFDEILNSTNN